MVQTIWRLNFVNPHLRTLDAILVVQLKLPFSKEAFVELQDTMNRAAALETREIKDHLT
jgi:hypothetical protein